MSIGLRELSLLVSSHDIESIYSLLNYDYEQEVRTSRGDIDDKGREEFLGLMSWRAKPTPTEIRRLFNQINSFYAEKWATQNTDCSPITFLDECNRLILFRQGKALGVRTSEIEFGMRMDLDFLDPRRQYKRLCGTTPKLIKDALILWADAVSVGLGNESVVLALVMTLIAIHPFSDGNGRLGRIAFTWLRARYGLEPLWLAEDTEGEFLRTGTGLASTEYIMAAVLLEICAGHNSVPYGGLREEQKASQAFDSLKNTLNYLRTPTSITKGDTLKRLQTHLLGKGHLRTNSPRFESIAPLLQP